jgi:ATP-binding cassette subfamily C (CFTR/MRP) protein 1
MANRCSTVVPEWDKHFDRALAKDAGQGKVSILGVMVRAFGPSYSLSAFLMLLLSVLQFANPQIVNLLINFVESDDPNWKGYLYTVLIVMVTFVITILNSQAFYREYLVGLRIRTGLISAIYRKSLRLSNSARKEMTGTAFRRTLHVHILQRLNI